MREVEKDVKFAIKVSSFRNRYYNKKPFKRPKVIEGIPVNIFVQVFSRKLWNIQILLDCKRVELRVEVLFGRDRLGSQWNKRCLLEVMQNEYVG